MEKTTRLALPLLSPGQSQKELVHNEALLALDTLVAGTVEEGPRTTPPSDPQPGQAYIVAQGASGDWTGLDGKILSFTPAGWRRQDPVEGQCLKVRATGIDAVYRSGAWELGTVRANSVVIGGQQVIGGRLGAVSTPAEGSVVDAEARACIAAILNALISHGLIASA